MKWILVVLGVLIAVGIIATLIGMALPQGHVASRTVKLSAPPERVWTMVSDVAAHPTWRPDVKSVEILSGAGAPLSWREVGKQGTVTYSAVESVAPKRFVGRIADRNLPYGGQWEYDIAPNGSGSSLTITERGEVYNPMFRFMARFVFGYTATIEGYLRALGTHLGETVTPT
jgi:uncharacterized protein YndB with AHSA1/START domain